MKTAELVRAVDDVATRDPERGGYGYADTQHPWRHDAAIEHTRSAFHDFLGLVRGKARSPTVLQIGLGPGRRAGTHLALLAAARRVVTVDADAARLDGLRRQLGDHAARSVQIAGDVDDDAVFAAVRDAVPACDVLLLDRDGYAGMRRAWQRCAALVRPGGLVALVDRSQAQLLDRPTYGVDRFVADLERDVLRPRGVQLVRFGGARAIHVYSQHHGTVAAEPPAWPPGFVPVLPAPLLGELHGFALHGWNGAVVAVPAAAGGFSPRALERNEYDVLLVAPDRGRAEALVGAWCAAAPSLEQARALLADERDAQAREFATAVGRAHPGLRGALLASLELAPWNRALLLALGTIDLFDRRGRQGVALLRRALRQELAEASLLRTVAAAYLRVLGDDAGARDLLDSVKRRVRARKVALICHQELRGNLLWQFPSLIADVGGVLQVGAGVPDALDWARLEVPRRTFVDADPGVCERIAAADAGAKTVAATLGAVAGPATLRSGGGRGRASLLPLHPLAVRGVVAPQTAAVAVQLQTLDELVAAGRIDAAACELLAIDTEGSELDVLRGATELLRHVDVISVAVFLQPVYDGAPLPQQVQAFLRDVDGDGGFCLRAFEPAADGVRGTAVFCRRKPRRSAR